MRLHLVYVQTLDRTFAAVTFPEGSNKGNGPVRNFHHDLRCRKFEHPSTAKFQTKLFAFREWLAVNPVAASLYIRKCVHFYHHTTQRETPNQRRTREDRRG